MNDGLAVCLVKDWRGGVSDRDLVCDWVTLIGVDGQRASRQWVIDAKS